jgi:hypothetical protein
MQHVRGWNVKKYQSAVRVVSRKSVSKPREEALLSMKSANI